MKAGGIEGRRTEGVVINGEAVVAVSSEPKEKTRAPQVRAAGRFMNARDERRARGGCLSSQSEASEDT